MPQRIVLLTEDAALEELADAFRQSAPEADVELIAEPTLAAGADLIVVDDVGAIAGLREEHPDAAIVLTATRGDVALARKAMMEGANDLLVRGEGLVDRAHTQLTKVRYVVALAAARRALLQHAPHPIVGTSSQIQDVIAAAERVAPIPRPVLIYGERGSGKELVARTIHEHAHSRERPFVVVNCASIAETLLDRELFGHEKGAFTGADRRVPGKFEQASRGTLFLDEIGHMPLSFQKKILRVVEYGTFTRVGGTQEVRVSTRLLAATNADLSERMDRGLFLRDLYDRLSFEEIRIPPLRERPEDIPVLASYFLERFMREIPAFHLKRLSAEALDELQAYPFPGNVRELKNIIERAAFRDSTDELTREDLGLPHQQAATLPSGTFMETIESLEKQLLEDALEAADGNQAEAARRLGLEYHQFRYYAKKHGVGSPDTT